MKKTKYMTDHYILMDRIEMHKKIMEELPKALEKYRKKVKENKYGRISKREE